MKRRIWQALEILLIVSCCGFFVLRPDTGWPFRLEREESRMSTSVQIILWGEDPMVLEKAMAAAFAELTKVEKTMSAYAADSEVSAINRSAGIRPVRVSPELFDLVRESLAFSELSNGCFDITVAALGDLWDFRLEGFCAPSRAEVERRLELVDYRKVRVKPEDGTILLEKPGMLISLGGIAKGYAVDRAVEALRTLGVKSGIVSAGGDVMVIGTREDGGPWRVGVRNPRNQGRLVCVLPVSNVAVATSGDYERFRIVDGVRYHHVLDPATGWPARGMMSATVVARRAREADALATAVFVLGPERGLDLLERLADTEGVIIDSSGKIRATSGLMPEEAQAAAQTEQKEPAAHP